MLDALATAADHRRDLVDVCGECPHTEGGLCATCDRWMTTIDEYESLADELRERRQ